MSISVIFTAYECCACRLYRCSLNKAVEQGGCCAQPYNQFHIEACVVVAPSLPFVAPGSQLALECTYFL